MFPSSGMAWHDKAIATTIESHKTDLEVWINANWCIRSVDKDHLLFQPIPINVAPCQGWVQLLLETKQHFHMILRQQTVVVPYHTTRGAMGYVPLVVPISSSSLHGPPQQHHSSSESLLCTHCYIMVQLLAHYVLGNYLLKKSFRTDLFTLHYHTGMHRAHGVCPEV